MAASCNKQDLVCSMLTTMTRRRSFDDDEDEDPGRTEVTTTTTTNKNSAGDDDDDVLEARTTIMTTTGERSGSTMPEPSESFMAKTRLPWSGEYRHIQDYRDLQDLFNHFREKKIDTMIIDVVIISLATMPQLAQCPQEPVNVMSSSESYPIPEDSANQGGSSEDSEDGYYMPYTSEIAKSSETSDNSCHDSATPVNEGNGNAAPGSSDNSDDDNLSNAAYFDYDLNNMVDSSSDEEEGDVGQLALDFEEEMDRKLSKREGNNRPPISRRGKPYKKAEGGRVVLEVGQLFNNLQHFRQVLRDFMVQEGFKLKRIKNDKERYTAECAYEGCSWRIHSSPVNDKTTFMIKTMKVRESETRLPKSTQEP
ncbi:hypothetical protein Dsin_032078 [Dipteronia sinensis]|uniref:Transposase MuDR plant domain-containing protein n=1 Tax=Dipteronia sinensis TaxID=43782 RepID=A0AAD9ZMV8_9ROSI|nr:hypothetical protein Dsin_032078 [Dipteronia sinensis]